jgi:cardiolipin synthase
VALIVGRDLLLVGVAARLKASGRAATLPVSHLGKVATFCLFYALPLIVLVEAFPVVAPVAAPIGWAFAIWGIFLYWWAGVRYASQAAALVRTPVGESHSVSDNVDSRGGRHGD